ncbi:beta-ketoacyl synthase N-terminal-like domain-containing protein [Sorangium sp. So ce204]|uniref:beta-ketoacyl synthase N-terminal-like domain-containing protein n=1 Tax=Sorangium sp. So ce204 TaxID=3133288 RepID=UPI003F62298B
MTVTVTAAPPAVAAPAAPSAVILGFGGCTASAPSAVGSCAAARASVSHFSLCEHAPVAGRHAFTIAAAPYLPPWRPADEPPVTVRLAALAARALDEVAAGLPVAPRAAVPVLLGVPSPRPGLPDDAVAAVSARVAAALAARGVSAAVEPFPLDHAAGLAALAHAVQRIEAGAAEVCLVGGVDSYLAASTLAWLHEREQLKSERNRWGLVAGEGAGFCVVASRALAEQRVIAPAAAVLAAATAREEVAPRAETPSLGAGLTAALRAALAPLGERAVVDEAVCDLNGERWRGDEAGFSIPRVARRLAEPGRITAPALAWGDVGAASGPLYLALSAHAAARGAARGPRALVWTSADGGARSAALLEHRCVGRE